LTEKLIETKTEMNFKTEISLLLTYAASAGEGVVWWLCREVSSMSWEHLSVLSVSGLALGAGVLTCAVCCCCRRRHQQRRRRNSYQQHDDDDVDLCTCACCPSTSGLYACKYSSVFKRL